MITPEYIRNHIRRPHIDTLLRSASVWDDDFNSLALDSKWTVKESIGTVSIGTVQPSCIMVWCSTTTGRYKIEQPYTSTDPFSITAKVLGPMQYNYSCAILEVNDADYSDAMRTRIEYNGNTQLRLSSRDSNSDNWNRQVTQLAGNTNHDTWYIHLQRNASNVWFSAASKDGISFVRTNTYTKSLTPAFIDINIRQDNSPFACYRGIDWFRVNWITL